MKLVVTIEGGLIQDFYTNRKGDVELIVVDYDTDWMYDDETKLINISEWGERRATVYRVAAEVNKGLVSKVDSIADRE